MSSNLPDVADLVPDWDLGYFFFFEGEQHGRDHGTSVHIMRKVDMTFGMDE